MVRGQRVGQSTLQEVSVAERNGSYGGIVLVYELIYLMIK